MTKEEILDYNKRCAEFLGWKETSEQFKIDWCGCKTKERLDKINKDYIPILEKDGNVIFPDFTVMDFSRDWNWIMQVVEAIEKLGYYTNILSAENNSMKHTMHINKVHEEEKYTLFVDSKKETVVQAINQFLIWYEQNK